ncbi:MAG: plastocyanin/azurin family copper-binding protein [Halovenus sp.]
MTSPDQETTDESVDKQYGKLPSLGRRPLLKALGAGTALSLGSGVASATHDRPHPPEIDAHYGYSTPDTEDIPKELEPDHEIELHIEYPPEGEDPEDHAPFYGHFAPSGLHVDAGDIVQFTFDSPEHTVTAYHRDHFWQHRVPEGAHPFSSPVVTVGGAWLYRFEEPGVYDIDCAPHNVFGMVMRLVVGDVDEEAYPPSVEDSWEMWDRAARRLRSPGTSSVEDSWGTWGRGELEVFPPWNKAMLEFERNEYSEANDGAEWPWMTPQEVLDSAALHPDNIQTEGTVDFNDVLEDMDRFPTL